MHQNTPYVYPFKKWFHARKPKRFLEALRIEIWFKLLTLHQLALQSEEGKKIHPLVNQHGNGLSPCLSEGIWFQTRHFCLWVFGFLCKLLLAIVGDTRTKLKNHELGFQVTPPNVLDLTIQKVPYFMALVYPEYSFLPRHVVFPTKKNCQLRRQVTSNQEASIAITETREDRKCLSQM